MPHAQPQAVHGVGGTLEVGHASPKTPLGPEGAVVSQPAGGGVRLSPGKKKRKKLSMSVQKWLEIILSK